MVFKGINVSPGIELGKAHIYRDFENVFVSRYPLKDSEIEYEISLFRKALEDTKTDIRQLHRKIADKVGENQAEIIQAHLLFLEDDFLAQKTVERIKDEQINAASVFSRVIDETADVFSSMGSHYLNGRVEDIKYIGRCVLKRMRGVKTAPLSEIREKVIIVARDISPADTALMDGKNIIAFVTDMGSRTSHTAIMARSIGIPAVVGLKNITEHVKNGDFLIVDGNGGEVSVNPGEKIIEEYKRKRLSHREMEKELGGLTRLPAQTLDGHAIKLLANIELPSEMSSVISHGADGVGLYRTEFLYLNRKDLPDEEEQYQAYREVVSAAGPGKVVIRTVDLGGDKFVSDVEMPGEVNPFMGWRGIRFCLEQPEIFRVQLRAILRASADGSAAVMFPLVSCIEELLEAKTLMEKVKSELESEKVPFDKNIETGVMIETPSAAMIADILADEAGFFSIGTNDLIQYAMAVDRVNEKVAHLYRPAHPGILRLIQRVIDSGHSKGVRVDMCGEMAGDDLFIIILLGMGIDGLSMSPVAIPAAKQMIRSTTYDHAKRLAEKVLKMSTSAEVESAVNEMDLPGGAAGTVRPRKERI